MASYLIVGLPGSGKTTLLRELSAQGYATLDADNDEELSQWRHRTTGEMTRHRQNDISDWNDHYDWSWNEARVQELTNHPPADPFIVGGNAANVAECYRFFDKVFALILDDTELTGRIKHRGKGYGSQQDELQKILEWNKDFAANEQKRGAVTVGANGSLSEVLSRIVEYIT